MVFWSFSWARLTSGRLNFILPHLRPFSWFCFFLLILFSHLRVASPSFTSPVSVPLLFCSLSLHRFFPPFSFCHCAFLWFLAASFPPLSVMSPPVLLSIWSFLSLFQCFGVECLCFPSLNYLAAWLLISCSLGSWQLLFLLSFFFWHKDNFLRRVR